MEEKAKLCYVGSGTRLQWSRSLCPFWYRGREGGRFVWCLLFLNYLQLKVILTPKWRVLAWHILTPHKCPNNKTYIMIRTPLGRSVPRAGSPRCWPGPLGTCPPLTETPAAQPRQEWEHSLQAIGHASLTLDPKGLFLLFFLEVGRFALFQSSSIERDLSTIFSLCYYFKITKFEFTWNIRIVIQVAVKPRGKP